MAGLFGWLRRGKDDARIAEAFAAALAAHQQGDLDTAANAYGEVLTVAPEHIDALSNLASVHGQRGDLPTARALLERARAASPEHAGVLVNLGNLYRIDGHLEAAEEAYRHALAAAPEGLDALRSLGLLLLDNGQPFDALPLLEQSRARAPDVAQCHYDAGAAYAACGNLTQAMACYRAALELDADHFPTHINLGNVLRQLDQVDEARLVGERAVALQPDSAVALNNLAGILGSAGEPEAGLPHVQRALALAPDNLAALGNHGALLASLGAYEQAREVLLNTLELDATDDGARFTLALAELAVGRFESGWRNYEAGLRTGARPSPARGHPRWQGDAIRGRALLLLPEQGVGDEIMFASCIPDALALAEPATCVFEADPRLKALLERSIPGLIVPPAAPVESQGRLDALPPFDYEAPVGSLAQWVRSSADKFPPRQGYLVCDELMLDTYRARLDQLGPALKVGISWRGGHDVRTRTTRTIDLEQWSAVLAQPDTHFIDLQYGDTQQELEAVQTQQQVAVTSWTEPDPLIDIDGFAALIKALDLVISIDNSTVHIAGAVGTPTFVMLPAVPDWRWQTHTDDSLWYPGMRLFRQPARGDWSSVMQDVADALGAYKQRR